MFCSRALLASLVATLWLVAPLAAGAQAPVQLRSTATAGIIAANGESVTLNNTGGLASLTLQTHDSYSGTLEVQCAADSLQTSFDADDEVRITRDGGSPAAETTDTIGIFSATINCTAVRVIATAGFAASNVTVSLLAITPGGGTAGGGAGAGDASLSEQQTQTAHLAAIETAVELVDNAVSGAGFNISQINGVTPLMGAGNTGTGAQRTTESTDSALTAAVQAIQTAVQLIDNAVSGAGFNISQIGGASPAAAVCDDPAKVTTFNINLGAGVGNTELVALNGSDLVYVCSFVYTTGGADTPQLIYGTGTACATGETDLMTLNLAAAGDGLVENGGGSVITKAPAGNALCLERTNSVTAMGRLGYVRQP